MSLLKTEIEKVIDYGIKTQFIQDKNFGLHAAQSVIKPKEIAKHLEKSGIRDQTDVVLELLTAISRLFLNTDLSVVSEIQGNEHYEDIDELLKPIADKYGIDWKGVAL